jgi:hypothetical protein
LTIRRESGDAVPGFQANAVLELGGDSFSAVLSNESEIEVGDHHHTRILGPELRKKRRSLPSSLVSCLDSSEAMKLSHSVRRSQGVSAPAWHELGI